MVKDKEVLREFAEIMSDPGRRGLSREQIAERFSISIPTIYNWLVTPEIKKLMADIRGQQTQSELPAIDKALIDRAKRGDVRAIELVYERWDGFVRREKKEVSGYIEGSEVAAEKKEEIKKTIREFLGGHGNGDLI